MSTQPQPSQLRSEHGMIDDCIRTLDGVIDTLTLQVLENTDALERHVVQRSTPKVSTGNQPEVEDSSVTLFRNLMVLMVKDPIRKQLGRCRNARRLLIELKTKLKKESPAHGS